MTDTATPADRYRRIAARFTALVNAVPADSWSNSSPCEGWTALDVLHHVVTTEADFLGRMPFAPGALPDGNPLEAPSLIGGWTTVRDHVQRSLDTPDEAEHEYSGYFGPTTFAATTDQFYAFDLVVHAWDIATAAGLAEYQAIDPTEIARHHVDFADLGATMRQPGLLGPELPPPDDADEQARFLAYLGRCEPAEAVAARRTQG